MREIEPIPVEIVMVDIHYLLPGETEALRVLRIPASCLIKETNEDERQDESLPGL